MAELLARLYAILDLAGPWLGPVLACAAFAEAMIVIGLFVPITPLLVASGAAMGSGVVGPALLPWIMAGGFLGSMMSYELGHQLRSHGLAQPRLPLKARLMAEQLFVEHGSLAIIAARFLGPPATVAPFIAGWSGLPRGRFIAANALSSLSWPPAMVGIGVLGVWLATR